MNKINLILALHNHQPVGNFDFVFKSAYENAYRPFLKTYEPYSNIRIVQHYTGILYDWFEENHPEFIRLLRQMVSNHRLELMTGGYYEPILTTIPDRDKIGQIRKQSEYIKAKFGFQSRGIWLAERVWEPDLPEPIHNAGVDYTVIDDSHFKYAGLEQEELYGYYITEHNGSTLKIFPISEKLRYTIPFHPPEETIAYLSELATADANRLLVFADDGEKFGIWPDTYEQCYEKGWLDRFFTLLDENSDWINIITFEQALEQLDPVGRIYLPTASYREMMEWALPATANERYERFEQWLDEKGVAAEDKVFVRGGFWRNFLAKYPESNNMHKRMLWASRRLEKLGRSAGESKLEQARDDLYAAQCNCPYWHGIFGGLYLPHLRHAIYHHIIKADKEMDRIEHLQSRTLTWLQVHQTDVDGDGHDDFIIESDKMSLFFSPHAGGHLFEWDFKAREINLLDTMTRRREGYHQKLHTAVKRNANASEEAASIHDRVMTKEEGLEKYLHYDWYRRSALVDHFFASETTLEDFYKAQYDELGDFVDQPYEVDFSKRGNKIELLLFRNGSVRLEEKALPVRLRKNVHITSSDQLIVYYDIQNLSDENLELWFATEFPFSLLAGNAHDRYYQHADIAEDNQNLASRGELTGDSLEIHDDWLDVHIGFGFEEKTRIWRFPIETISMSEGGFERIYQSSVVVPSWRVAIEPEKIWKTKIDIQLNKTG
ncbi:DUF1926 domain-containing protein [candidate division KSB1 bacterium]|nr:DUF1926 domain-containing protein [candidate division KSB1 bacterium]